MHPVARGLAALLSSITLVTVAPAAESAAPPAAAAADEPPEAVLLHPIYKDYYACMEHWQGQLQGPGDALGSDCLIQHLVTEQGRTWVRPYRGDGRRNSDWFGWRQPVLAPCDGRVVSVHVNTTVNRPGTMGKPPAAALEIERADGVHVVLAHVADVRVAVGATVSAGQPVAVVGNNGYSRSPHIHVGAWRGRTPLQIRFDLSAMGRLMQTP